MRHKLETQWLWPSTNRKYLLESVGCTPFEVDYLSHTEWNDLPLDIRESLTAQVQP